MRRLISQLPLSFSGVTQDDIKLVLTESAKLKMPRFTAQNGGQPLLPRTKIGHLEDFLLATARWRGHLEQARLHAHTELKQRRKRWDHMAGWEGNRREGERSVASVEDAKRVTDPPLYDEIQDFEWLVKRLSEQISRLQHDDDVASRAYTLLTGGS